LDRGEAKTALTHQVLKEPRELIDERDIRQRATASREPRNNKTKHLLNRATDVLHALSRSDGSELSSATRGDPLDYERLDVSG